MTWKRGSTSEELLEDGDIKTAEENYENFCNQLASHPQLDYLKPPLNFSIPPIIHFIWLGSPLSTKVQAAIESWRRCHPEWELMIWTDAEVNDFSWSTPRLYSAFTDAESFAEKSDILHYEILYQFGGIYSDTDVVCFKSFHDLITKEITFFAGIETNHFNRNFKDPLYKPLYIGAAIMGAIKGSPVIKYCLDHYRTSEEAPTVGLVMRAGPGLASCACRAAFDPKRKRLFCYCPAAISIPYLMKTSGLLVKRF